MHSLNQNGILCVNLNDYNELSDSILYREKIDYLTKSLDLPREISNFSISMLFGSGKKYYLSNLYIWAIPYHTEGLYRGDIDHHKAIYQNKEFFIQRDISYDEMQLPIIQVLENRYKLNTTFAMIREHNECDFIIEAYNKEKVTDPEKLYLRIHKKFEQFIVRFLDSMLPEIRAARPEVKWLTVFSDNQLRKDVITRRANDGNGCQLTKRELQCLGLISQGMSNKQIAEKIHLSTETIHSHTKSIRNKLSCANITEAVTKAIRRGWI